MNEYLLRLEGVNLAAFLDDTNDLSTIRGAGLLLLKAVEDVKGKYFTNDNDVISTGASSGLFRFRADDGGIKMRDDIEKHLNADPRYRHATFVIDVEPLKNNGDFNRAREAVLAKNRLRQMRAPSIAFPSCTGNEPCHTDAIRPAKVETRAKDGKTQVRVSESVHQRREFGREQKRGDFYHDQLKALGNNLGFLNGHAFAKDFQTIASDDGQGNLHKKLAVLYVDGNAFGDKQTRCGTPDNLRAFDRDVKQLRRAFLHDLLQDMAVASPIRLETLLWGGDEMMFVAPAWQGWWLMNLFFEKSKTWQVKVGAKDEELHHAAGLVFCHHNAPIARIKHLAKGLAELVKSSLGPGKPHKSGCTYLALESFDSVGLDLEHYLNHTLLGRSGVAAHGWMLAPEAVKDWLTAFQGGLADALSKRQVHRTAHALATDGVPVDKLKSLLEEEDAGALAQLEALRASLPQQSQALLPLHLALLWDYLACYQKPTGSR